MKDTERTNPCAACKNMGAPRYCQPCPADETETPEVEEPEDEQSEYDRLAEEFDRTDLPAGAWWHFLATGGR